MCRGAQVDYRVYRVEAERVNVKLGQPVERVLHEEAAHAVDSAPSKLSPAPQGVL